MKRYILTLFLSLVLFAGSAFATGYTPQVKEKSEVEKHMQSIAKSKPTEIDYTYISATMFKQMLSILDANIDVQGGSFPLASIKSLRQFTTTGSTGYRILSEAMKPFLQEDETVMGMELMALNKEGGAMTAIYGGQGNILLISDEEDEMSVLFIVGLGYDEFKTLYESGVNIDF
ncbi:MAG: hypothetical protein IKY37_06240 [Bacteroidaceae bacterium]|nr:hypothetical protein [Bacteroidaceae bacterium]